jgi:hypothetical protein
LRLAAGSRMPGKKELSIKMGQTTKQAVFEGRTLEVKF